MRVTDSLPAKQSAYGVLTRRRLVWSGLLSLLALTAIAFAVGHFAAREHTGYFDWELASIFGTALGTTALAIATGALAFTTSGDVRATWELARLTREDQERSERPLVLVQAAEWQPRLREQVPGEDLFDQTGALRVSLRNVGLGPALRVEVSARYMDDELQPTIIDSKIVPAIPAGTETWVEIVVTFRTPEFDFTSVRPDGFPVHGTYLSRSRVKYDVLASWEDDDDGAA
jgi:hypothetical protein